MYIAMQSKKGCYEDYATQIGKLSPESYDSDISELNIRLQATGN
jgi:hypothetical protein